MEAVAHSIAAVAIAGIAAVTYLRAQRESAARSATELLERLAKLEETVGRLVAESNR